MRFDLYRDKKGQGRWRLLGGNGAIVADSGESYTRTRDAARAVRAIQRSAALVASASVRTVKDMGEEDVVGGKAAQRASSGRGKTLTALVALLERR